MKTPGDYFQYYGKIFTKNIANATNIGDKYGNLEIIGVPFAIKNDGFNKITCAVVECQICKTISVALLRDIKYRAKKGDLCCLHCSATPRLLNRWKNKSRKSNDRNSRLYNIWANMKGRCNGKLYKHNKSYNEKGIKVCEEWKKWINFKNWAYANGYYEQTDEIDKYDKLCIDRIDSRKDYCPENCRWVSFRENAFNITRSKDKIIEYLEKLLDKHNIKYDYNKLI
jgi:hypothetical protein